MPKSPFDSPPFIIGQVTVEDELIDVFASSEYRDYTLKQHDDMYGLGDDTTGTLDVDDNLSTGVFDPDSDQTITGEWTFTTHPLGLDHAQIDNLDFPSAGHTGILTMDSNIVMADNSITGIDTLTFTDVNGTIAGIQNQNLVDKTAAESISDTWTWTGGGIVLEDNISLGLGTGGTDSVIFSDGSDLNIANADGFRTLITGGGLSSLGDALLDVRLTSSGITTVHNTTRAANFAYTWDSDSLNKNTANSLQTSFTLSGDSNDISNQIVLVAAAFTLTGSGNTIKDIIGQRATINFGTAGATTVTGDIIGLEANFATTLSQTGDVAISGEAIGINIRATVPQPNRWDTDTWTGIKINNPITLLNNETPATVSGIWINALVEGARTGGVDYGIVLNGDGLDIVFGAAQDAFIRYENAQGLIFSETTDNAFEYRVSADTDITMNFIGTTNSGQYLWMEDEDYFQFNDDIFVGSEEVLGNKFKITSIGGYAIKLTNTTGVNTVQGEVVKSDPATNNAVILSTTSDDDILGVFLESGIVDDAEAWVVVTGIAEVKADGTGFARGDRVISSTATVGRVETDNTPAVAAHFTEVGHALERAQPNAVGKCVLHFN